MKILLVEENAAEAALVATVLKQLGHAVFATQNGVDALDHYVRQRPDLVLTTPSAPGLDGFALTREILHRAAPRWQPVAFLCAQPDERLEARASDAGADACFCKPLSVSALRPRLTAIARLLRVQDMAERRVAELHHQLAAQQAEVRAARQLIDYQMAPGGPRQFEDPALQLWRHAGGSGSDMVLFARTPGGRLHLLLADAGCDGLSACLSLQPLIAPFYRMTERGCGVPALVRELNRKLRQSLPAGCPIAAQLVSVDPGEGIVGIWNGGMPPAVMLDDSGRRFYEFPLLHAPLGVLDNADFDARFEQRAYGPDEQLVMVSDGVLDVLGANGARFGEDGLAAALVASSRAVRQARIVAALDKHLAGTPANDDMTLVLLDCEQAAPPLAMPLPGPLSDGTAGNWCCALRLDAEALRQIDAVPLLLGMVDRFPVARAYGGELFVVLSELFDNALDHGLLRLDARLRHSPEGLETWLMMREERLAALKADEGEIRLWVEQAIDAGRICLRVRCQDSGPGFQLERALQPRPAGQEGGLMRLKGLAHVVDIVARGGDVRVLMRLPERAPA